jgi:hypothetical protein
VLLVTDGASTVPVQLVRDGTPALATGRGDGTIELKTLEVGENPFKRGDIVVTSGVGGIYPPGIPVAIVVGRGDITIARPLADPGPRRFRDRAARYQPAAAARSTRAEAGAAGERRNEPDRRLTSRDMAMKRAFAPATCRSARPARDPARRCCRSSHDARSSPISASWC